MHPILFHIPWVNQPVYTYGVAFASAILIGVFLSSRRIEKEGGNVDHYLMAMIFAIAGILVMSKVMHIVVTWSEYAENPKLLWNCRRGHVFYGGYIGAILFPFIYVKLVHEKYLPFLDAAATYMPLGLAWHRALGCFNAGCCHGRPTDHPWGVTFPEDSFADQMYHGMAVHPTQLYEAAAALIMFGILLYWRNRRQKISGEIITLQIGLYAVARFIIEFYRGDTVRGFFWKLSTSQWVSVGMLTIALIGAFLLHFARRRAAQTPTPQGAEG